MNENVKTVLNSIKPRSIVKFVVGHSTRFVVTTAIVKLVEPETTADKARVVVGGYVVGGLLAEHTEDFAMRKYDKIAGDVTELKQQIDNVNTTPPAQQ